ncbi:hypothetical protein ADEAN_000100700 [Angomonas deanei]|uniref:Uncharacterized protein n=1 Tax=Angomonas deanei TaxID=59799 RepID=A0A7G2C2U4_9TRYP|nr:hypothetical protein ADEAN_000100700 [Angomonas deanei]
MSPSLLVCCGAVQCLHILLHLLKPSLQYAEEPRIGTKKAGLRSKGGVNTITLQGGSILYLLHYLLTRSILATVALSEAENRRTSGALNVAATPQWIHLLAVLVSVTHYQNFSESLRCLSDVLAKGGPLFNKVLVETDKYLYSGDDNTAVSPVCREPGESNTEEYLHRKGCPAQEDFSDCYSASYFLLICEPYLPEAKPTADTSVNDSSHSGVSSSVVTYTVRKRNVELIRYITNLSLVSISTLYSHLFSNESLFGFIMNYCENIQTFYSAVKKENSFLVNDGAMQGCRTFNIQLEAIMQECFYRDTCWRLFSSISKSYPQLIKLYFEDTIVPHAKKLMTAIQEEVVNVDMKHARIFFEDDEEEVEELSFLVNDDEETETIFSSEGHSFSSLSSEELRMHVLSHILSTLRERDAAVGLETDRYATTAEALRMCLRYMSFVWESFDHNYSDKARESKVIDSLRAGNDEKQTLYKTLLFPLMQLMVEALELHQKGDVENDVRSVSSVYRRRECHIQLLRCVANLGEEFVGQESFTKKDKDYIFKFVEQSCGLSALYSETLAKANLPTVKVVGALECIEAEAFNTLGLFSWKYNTFIREYGERMVTLTTTNLFQENLHHGVLEQQCLVKSKAAFALANFVCHLPSAVEPSSDARSVIRNAPASIDLLCSTAVYCCAMINPWIDLSSSSVVSENAVVSCKTVQSHGLRMISHLLWLLTYEELIEELDMSLLGDCCTPSSRHTVPRTAATGE